MKRTSKPEPVELIRINRYLSMCGIASRRKADELVTNGSVQVNGKVMTDLGRKIDPQRDKVFLEGKQVAQVHDYLYLVMNKPKDAITTLSDEKGRTTVMSLVRTKQRVYPIGRLDRNTTGVLLLTNDGEFANRLMHPKFEISKSYQVSLETALTHEHAEKLRKGMKLEDGKTSPAEVYIIPGGKGKEIGIIIHEGRNRQVRRMFESLGYEVKKLDRVAYGPVTKEGIARGGTRSLTRPEVRQLRKLAGMVEEF
ncbi:MAG: rRNA pseudouridine synthase [Ignavibacteriae bacterium]|nr:rRNA pseudouridine synthase [Ignavibacteriota bacterium]